jgi:hypothetical protein
MFENLGSVARIELARAKMTRVLDHFLYLLELHANNAHVVYSPLLSSQIPQSFAANAFNVFQRSMQQFEIVRLCALWDRPDPAKENIPTVIELIDDDTIVDALADETRKHWTNEAMALLNLSSDPALSAAERQAVRRSNALLDYRSDWMPEHFPRLRYHAINVTTLSDATLLRRRARRGATRLLAALALRR